jgi:phosphatidylserine synthase
LLTALHFLANKYSLYWSVWWYDSALHFLGGILLGAVSVWFISSTPFRSYSKVKVIVFSMLVALIVAVFWELFEYAIGFTYHHFFSYKFDTYKDIVVAISATALFTILTVRTKVLAK